MIDNVLLIFYLSMAVMFLFLRHFYSKELRFEHDIFVKFCGFMVVVVLVRLTMMSFLQASGSYIPTNMSFPIPLWQLGMVWWEDLFFVFPLILLKKYNKKKLLVIIGIISASIFASGHLYQGPMGLISLFYLYVSYRFGRKYGLGTVMMCHILYDFVVYFLSTNMVSLLS